MHDSEEKNERAGSFWTNRVARISSLCTRQFFHFIEVAIAGSFRYREITICGFFAIEKLHLSSKESRINTRFVC